MIRLESQTRITLFYIIFGAFWIFWSDKSLNVLVANADLLTGLQTIKGWLFILITAVFLYLMIMQSNATIRAQEQEKVQVYDTTLSGMHHILNNFLNQMMIFRLEAEQSEDFDPEVLAYYDGVIGEAKGQISRLDSVADVTAESIREAIYGR